MSWPSPRPHPLRCERKCICRKSSSGGSKFVSFCQASVMNHILMLLHCLARHVHR